MLSILVVSSVEDENFCRPLVVEHAKMVQQYPNGFITSLLMLGQSSCRSGLQLISHVIFTDDGNAPWESKSRMHTVRRSFCSQWYNDRWRDCLLAWVSYLAQNQGVVSLPVCSQAALELRCLPRLHTSFVIFEKVAPIRLDDSAIGPSDDVDAASDLLDSEPGIDETEEDEEED